MCIYSVLSGSRDKEGCIVIHDMLPSAAVTVDEEVGGVSRAPIVARILR